MGIELLEKQAANAEDVLRDLSREVSKIKSIVKDAVDDGVQTALRTVKDGREAAEDKIDDSKKAIKQNPLEAMGIVFAAGVLVGCLAVWVGRRRS